MPAEKMKIHFIGIGGIGVSALARYYLEKGHKVSGSDLASSEITKGLRKRGARIRIGPASDNLGKFDLVVYTPAAKGIKSSRKIKSYPEALGELTKKYFTLAVAGTHGKSTTAAMLALILEEAGLDPTCIIGTKLKEFGNSNCRVGKSRYLVIEADEHFGSFLNYSPNLAVITNIEKDHLDYYKNYGNLVRAFGKFAARLPENGILVCPKEVSEKIGRKGKMLKDGRKLKKILKVPGDHNVDNALAALTAAESLGISEKTALKALSKFRGTWRRFETKFDPKRKIWLVSDYAHHPTEIEATLKAARRKWPNRKIWCLFQPHQYQRTFYLFNDFAKTLRKAPADKIIVTDIFDVAGREEKKIKRNVSAEKLARAAKNASYLPKKKAVSFLRKNVKPGQVLIIMGAGDIYKLFYDF